MDRYEYETRIFDATCSLCSRTTHGTTEKLESYGWTLRCKDTRCPAHSPAMEAMGERVRAITESFAGHRSADVLERAAAKTKLHRTSNGFIVRQMAEGV